VVLAIAKYHAAAVNDEDLEPWIIIHASETAAKVLAKHPITA